MVVCDEDGGQEHVGRAPERSRNFHLLSQGPGGCCNGKTHSAWPLGLSGAVRVSLLPVSGLLYELVPLSVPLSPFYYVNFYSSLSGSWSWIRVPTARPISAASTHSDHIPRLCRAGLLTSSPPSPQPSAQCLAHCPQSVSTEWMLSK